MVFPWNTQLGSKPFPVPTIALVEAAEDKEQEVIWPREEPWRITDKIFPQIRDKDSNTD